MFVSCGNCDAEYELDDAKIPVGGARLRCKQCDRFFVVSAPEPGDLQEGDDLGDYALAPEAPGWDALEPGGPAAADVFGFDDGDTDAGLDLDLGGDDDPDAKLDLADDVDLDDAAVFGAEVDSAGEAGGEGGAAVEVGGEADIERGAPLGDEGGPDVESDWEFNEDVERFSRGVGGAAPGSAPDRGAAQSDLPDAEDAVDDLLGASGGIGNGAAAAVDDLLGDRGADALELGDDLADAVSGGDPQAGPEQPSAALDLGDADALAGASGDLGDLSDWDLFDDPAAIGASPAAAGAAGRAAAFAPDGARGEPRVELAVAVAEDAPVELRWTDRIAQVAGWGAVVALLVAALVGGVAAHSSDARAPTGRWSGAGFEADQISGRWVENAVAGSIYVVSGRIRNAGDADRASRSALGVRLIDATGREIDRDPIPLGPALPERILRESSPAEIAAYQQRRAPRIASVGASWVAFEAALVDVPPFARRFELHAYDRGSSNPADAAQLSR